MILWLALFFLVIAISFILALQSMKEYQEIPLKSKEEYALYLIRNTSGLNARVLEAVRSHIVSDGLIISIERLIKGQKAALTMFGPKRIMEQFSSELSLLELEDYSLGFKSDDVFIWEMGIKNKQLKLQNLSSVLKNLPVLAEDEQFLWQMVLSAKVSKDFVFDSQIRAGIYSRDSNRRDQIAPLFQNLEGELVRIPRPLSPEQMVSSYRLRSLSKDSQGPLLYPDKVLDLIKI